MFHFDELNIVESSECRKVFVEIRILYESCPLARMKDIVSLQLTEIINKNLRKIFINA